MITPGYISLFTEGQYKKLDPMGKSLWAEGKGKPVLRVNKKQNTATTDLQLCYFFERPLLLDISNNELATKSTANIWREKIQ